MEAPETGELVTSCTITVTEANALTRAVHDRVPMVLDRADVSRWRDGGGRHRTSEARPG
jgi:putative SOS response-associated peptidase YedK